MTCDECRAVIGKNPSLSTTAEIASAIVHMDKCPACDDWSGQYTVENREELVKEFDKALMRVMDDPEALAVVAKGMLG